MSAATLIQLLPGTLVDAEALLASVVASLIAGVLVTFAASLAIWGFATAAEMQRHPRDLAAVGAGTLAVVATLAMAAAIALGLYVMING